jgi:hypothetical protein
MTGIAKRRLGEGLFVVALGAGILALIPSQVHAISGLETNMSPAFIPLVAGVALIVVGAALGYTAVFGREEGKAAVFAGNELPRVLFSTLLLLAYTWLFPVVGFMTTSVVFIGAFAYFFGQRDPRRLLAVMTVAPALVWALFEIIFVIPLPHGLIF